ncbi:MAG: FAD-binding protein [Myxococcota bacterium]
MSDPLPMAEDGLYHPRSEADIVALVQRAAAAGQRLRVRGSLHTFPRRATFTDEGPGAPHQFNLQLDLYRSIVMFDKVLGRVEVEAGCNLGSDPELASSTGENGLLQQIDAAGWGFSDLGGITHQTASGFVSTGSSGGSVRYAIEENIVALRIVDGTGQVRVFERGTDEGFAGAAVALGLFGVISTITFQCEPGYAIFGQEATTTTADCAIDLFDGGLNDRPSLETFLREADYSRFLWWPQHGVDRVVVWQAQRMPVVPGFRPVPYEPSGVKAETVQALAGLMLAIVGNLEDLPALPGKIQPIFDELDDHVADDLREMGFSAPVSLAIGSLVEAMLDGGSDGILALPGIDTLGEWLHTHLDDIVPPLFRAFVKLDSEARAGKPVLFQDYWWRGLPMDNGIQDDLMPTWFTELWIPLDRASEVMRVLRDHFAKNGLSATGTYAFEFYAARKNDIWMSPAYGADVFRVDPFWFGYNDGDPVAFFQQFWDLLEPFAFRLHPGKFMPPDPDGKWAAYLRTQHPHWDDFLALRAAMDPAGVFLTPYWREHFGIRTEVEGEIPGNSDIGQTK